MKNRCLAKINLFLKVVGKSGDFHDLETALVFLDLCDEIEVKNSDKFSLKIDGEFSDKVDNNNNIIIDIHNYFIDNFKVDQNLEISLTKNIPVGAGLGGGSSDGAEFMKILNEMFKLNLTKTQLQEISFNFGSDIAFFFENKSSLIRGRGNVEKNLNQFDDVEILVINPRISLSTKEVFTKFHDSKCQYSQKISNEEIDNKDIYDLIDISNDLTDISCSIVGEISEILLELKNQGAIKAKMSGSGASCFGVFRSEKIDNVKKKIEEKFSDYLVKKAKISYER